MISNSDMKSSKRRNNHEVESANDFSPALTKRKRKERNLRSESDEEEKSFFAGDLEEITET